MTQQQEPQKKKAGNSVNRFTPGVIAGDLLTAAFVGGIVAAPISIVDFSIMAKVAGIVPTMWTQVIAGTKTMFTDPKTFFFVDTPTTKYAFTYRLCAGVYVGTYIVANLSRSFFEGQMNLAPGATAYNTGVTSSAVNIGLTIWKDSNILQCMPSASTSAAGTATKVAAEKVVVPLLSQIGFATRDAMTCIAAFTVVPLLKDHLKSTNPEWSDFRCQTTASLLTPCGVQIVSTNIHVPAIKYQRMYNPTRKWGGAEGYAVGMLQALKSDYVSALQLRCLRIFFAFGLGTILNAEVRPRMIRMLEPKAFD